MNRTAVRHSFQCSETRAWIALTSTITHNQPAFTFNFRPNLSWWLINSSSFVRIRFPAYIYHANPRRPYCGSVCKSLVGLSHHDGYTAWPQWEISVNCLTQGHNNKMPNSSIEPATFRSPAGALPTELRNVIRYAFLSLVGVSFNVFVRSISNICLFRLN